METEIIYVDGEEVEIVIKIPKEEMDHYNDEFLYRNLEDTIELGVIQDE